MKSNIQIAETIRQQIGSRALFMIGAKNLCAVSNGLSFKVGRNSEGVTHVRITLEASDTYRLEFLKIRGFNAPVVVADVDMVYNDGLTQVIESKTGLRTSL